MRIINFITILAFTLLIVGCATINQGIDAFKGQTAQQIYIGGMQALKKNNYDSATQHFEALEALYPFGNYSEQAQLHLISAYYQNSDYDAAAAVAVRYIHLYPRSSHVTYAYYMQGMANFSKNQIWLSKIYVKDPSSRDLSAMQEAFINFSDLVTQFPHSKYTPDARMRMVYIRNMTARHELQVATFYMEHKAYVAAANRASYIVEHYKGTPQVIDALEIMVKAYTALGDTKQANDAYRVLHLNYPNAKI